MSDRKHSLDDLHAKFDELDAKFDELDAWLAATNDRTENALTVLEAALEARYREATR